MTNEIKTKIALIVSDRLGFSNRYYTNDQTYKNHCLKAAEEIIALFSEPITIEQLLSEHPQVVEKIFEAAREITWQPAHEEGIVFKNTPQDYINSLKV